MLSIETPLEQMKADPDCELLPTVGLPQLPEGLALPADLEYFYSHCGGVECFSGEDFDYPFRILPPDQCIQSNTRCITTLSHDELLAHLGADHFSWAWYAFADFDWGGEECVAISLNQEAFGRCYDCSRWEIYPSTETLWATSFTDFLARLYKARGLIWRDDLFNPE
jgi:hypothetical protein